MNNHYETLGFNSSATTEEIKTAYRKLSKKFHPDNNSGDAYFENMFSQIQEAYDTLSNNASRLEYDRKNNFNQLTSENSNPEVKNNSPEIIYFESDKDSFEEGESIRLSWKTTNVDEVIIKPFGNVDKSGTKVFKLKNFDKETLSITLQATNNSFDETITKTIKLKNNITEFDFATIQEDEEVQTPEKLQEKVEIPEPVKEKPKVYANSFAPPITTANIQTTESFFSSDGRLRRSTYFWRSLLLGIPGILMYSTLSTTYDESSIIFLAIIFIVIAILAWIQTIKRLHDLNNSGWLSLMQLIPVVNFIFGLYLLFSDSNKGPNKYGEDPKARI